MEREFHRGDFVVDAATGEASPSGPNAPNISLDAAAALSKRLGNIDQIGALRAAAREVLTDGDSVIMRRVLYSGSHSGDAVPREEFARLREELKALAAVNDPDLNTFVADMRALLASADTEGNPIAFV